MDNTLSQNPGQGQYRPISILSVIAKALEKSLLPYITANYIQTQHSVGTTHTK